MSSDQEKDLRGRLARAVGWRWPRERLLLTTGCLVDRLPTKGEWMLGILGRAHTPGGARIDESTYHDAEALLGVTQTRLIYQTRGPHGLLLKVASLVVLGFAVLGLLVTGRLGVFAWAAAVAAGLFLLSRVAEGFGVGSGHVEFGRLRSVDPLGRSIEGVGHWGTVYRFRIPDDSDFRMIAAMADGHGSADAA